MRTQRLLTLPHSFFLLVASSILLFHPIRILANNDFIQQSCSTTLYPDVCISSLSPHASAIQQNSAQLARLALETTLTETQNFAAYLNNLAQNGANFGATPALKDCVSNLGDAVDQIKDSLNQMEKLGAAGNGATSLRFELSNIQTWMSSALTNADTCTEGFSSVANGPLKKDVSDRATKVKKLTSIALALVNSYAAKSAH